MSIAGGGGGGITGLSYYSTGSSGGFLASYPVNLTPGESIAITVGTGGIETANGGVTSFGSYLSCSGGYSSAAGPVPAGNCGVAGGIGATSSYFILPEPIPDYSSNGGFFPGGITSLGYGSGGGVNKCSGCSRAVHGGAMLLSFGVPGRQGVVMVDVMY